MSTAELSLPDRFVAEHSATVPIAEELLVRVLDPYEYKGCRYLKHATYSATEDSVLAYGTFGIGDPAYIRSTGHFNAVELIICFNQLAYSAFAPAILNEVIPQLRGWSIDDYFDYQLPSMLIKNLSSRFKRIVNAGEFHARLLCQNFEVMDRSVRYLKVPCAIEFWDANGGSAFAEVELAALNIP